MMCLFPAYAVLFRNEHRTRHLCPIVHRIACISIFRPQLRNWNNTCLSGVNNSRIRDTAWSVRSSCRNNLQKYFQLCILNKPICSLLHAVWRSSCRNGPRPNSLFRSLNKSIDSLLHAVRRSSCRNDPRPNSLSRTLNKSIDFLLHAVRRSSCRNGLRPNSPFRTLNRPRRVLMPQSVPV